MMNKHTYIAIFLLTVLIIQVYISSINISSVSSPKKIIKFLSIESFNDTIIASGYITVNKRKNPIIILTKKKIATVYQFSLPYTAYFKRSKIIGGYIYSIGTIYVPNSLSYDILFVKFKPPDKIIWVKTYGSERYDSGSDFILSSNNTFILIGDTYSYSKLGDADILIMKTDEEGKILKSIVIGTEAYDDTARKIKKLKDNNFMLLGETWSYNVSMSDVFLVKINNNLNILWANSYGGPSYEEAIDLEEIRNEMWIVGVSRSFVLGGNDGFVLRLDKDGNMLSILGIGSNDDDGLLTIGYENSTVYLLGYIHLRENEQDPLIAFMNAQNGEIVNMYLLEHEGYETLTAFSKDPHLFIGKMSIGNDTIFAIKYSNNAPINKFVYYSTLQVKQIGILKIKNFKEYITFGDWKKRKQALIKKPVSPVEWNTEGNITYFDIPRKTSIIQTGEYVKKINWIKEIGKTLENNVPLLIMSIPFIALLLAAIILKTKKILIRRFS